MEWIAAKKIISGYAADNPWFGSHYNMNIYKGCSHGCIYCDSRSACYRIEHFDEVRAKENALDLIDRELRGKRKTGIIGMGAMSDPYNPMEKKYALTRGALERIDRHGFGVAIATKSDLIVRDMDILKRIAKHSPVLLKITITAAEDELSKKVEPRVAPSSARFKAVQALAAEQLFVGVLLMPVLPFIEDTVENITKIIDQSYQSGARFIYPGFGVTLRENQREWYYDQLDQSFPGIKSKYMQQFGDTYSCASPNAKVLMEVLKHKCKEYRMLYQMKAIVESYKAGYNDQQLSFF